LFRIDAVIDINGARAWHTVSDLSTSFTVRRAVLRRIGTDDRTPHTHE
jgi:hypothetical protein